MSYQSDEDVMKAFDDKFLLSSREGYDAGVIIEKNANKRGSKEWESLGPIKLFLLAQRHADRNAVLDEVCETIEQLPYRTTVQGERVTTPQSVLAAIEQLRKKE